MCGILVCNFYHECGHAIVCRLKQMKCKCHRLTKNSVEYNLARCFLCGTAERLGCPIQKPQEDIYRARLKWRKLRQHTQTVAQARLDQKRNIDLVPNWKRYSYVMYGPTSITPLNMSQIPSKTQRVLSRLIQPRFHLARQVQPIHISQDKDVCLICHGNLLGRGEKCDSSAVVALPCGHFFGKECIEVWIWNRGRCPMCQTGYARKAYANMDLTPLLGDNRLGLFEDIRPRCTQFRDKAVEGFKLTIFTLLFPLIVIVYSAAQRPLGDVIVLVILGLCPLLFAIIYKVMCLGVFWRLLAMLLARIVFSYVGLGHCEWRYPRLPREIILMNMGPFALLIPFLACYRDAAVTIRGSVTPDDFQQGFVEHILSLGYISYFSEYW